MGRSTGIRRCAADSTGPLDERERKQLDVVRRFGTVGSLLLAVGSLGAGAAPVFNPVWSLPVLRPVQPDADGVASRSRSPACS